MYNLPKFSTKEIKNKTIKTIKNKFFWGVILLIAVGCAVGFSGGVVALKYFPTQTQQFLQYFSTPEPKVKTPAINKSESQNIYTSAVAYEQAVIDAAKNVSPSVVSIVISGNVPTYEEQFVNPFGDFGPFNIQIPQQVQNGTQYREIGAGSGFIISADGLVLTNRHVVSSSKADYAVFTNDGEKYTAKVLAQDPVQDLAIIKIQSDGKTFKPVKLGDSSGIQIGQTAIAIGNALGQFSNTVSVGVVSGLQRTISASDGAGSFSETLEGIIQTDAAINTGNSGGPLLNLRGEVIGINTAMAQDAQGIGFAIPINMVKRDIEQVKKTSKITYPFLGVRYVLVDSYVKKEYKLSVGYGALVLKGDKGEPAVTSGSPAAKAGIKAGDVILEVNGEKLTSKNSMSTVIQKYNVGDKVKLHILRGDKEQDIDVTLAERSL
ncbi:MAG: trypsin-like peptidase domain-containing protein [Candidatus Staskawiczbacteria bacterium]|nr:trypsin-like peptidase domain-containing protein [Candidatus Staskawiczbacteria bacterium]